MGTRHNVSNIYSRLQIYSPIWHQTESLSGFMATLMMGSGPLPRPLRLLKRTVKMIMRQCQISSTSEWIEYKWTILLSYTLRNEKWERRFIRALNHTAFEGVTVICIQKFQPLYILQGPVQFKDNSRRGNILINQIVGMNVWIYSSAVNQKTFWIMNWLQTYIFSW